MAPSTIQNENSTVDFTLPPAMDGCDAEEFFDIEKEANKNNNNDNDDDEEDDEGRRSGEVDGLAVSLENTVDSPMANAALSASTPPQRLFSASDLTLTRTPAVTASFVELLEPWVLFGAADGSVDDVEADGIGNGHWRGFQPRKKRGKGSTCKKCNEARDYTCCVHHREQVNRFLKKTKTTTNKAFWL